MWAKRIVTVVIGVAAAGGLAALLRESQPSRDAGTGLEPAAIAREAAAQASEAAGASTAEPARAADAAGAGAAASAQPDTGSWAADAEQRIGDILSDVGLLRPSTNLAPPSRAVECRTTFCRVVLDVDRAGLIDHLRATGRYDEAWPRDSQFTNLTLTSGWARDRAEELRLALVLSGLFEEDSEVVAFAEIPVYREQDSHLSFDLYRCPRDNELCGPP
ncbi:MAG TPA: hypothetical protein VE907_23700 [Gammaproteobacteria bacterium]|nr:hypothetical protein [Gammaproteobacteria bacterium]